ncbi:hypothetical protein [Erwinia mallotivora]|uniref:hypothetical protein n=1 Tax=Erwinia mallotivora TaxID=69222 RepID=UPI0021BFBF56|nr:hypothetical protein [Erwinia mallotivora]
MRSDAPAVQTSEEGNRTLLKSARTYAFHLLLNNLFSDYSLSLSLTTLFLMRYGCSGQPMVAEDRAAGLNTPW